ncbi:hypothetical protein GLOTRDRAFT_33370 [Gloeophyllum trabeum ATCC 11539]|uniref:Uncharacterized protein n=1 Tax=Gloeophyllum trabeum (strain ATCC 11539 / FP-39264 / Madison 617) TaxID=670483 RepID=S7QIJ7_GLOTA|nr:uncharacterized protein GLOTRDRAFT_33370 [Gloeophyllum trabeum ATCC 11539]EPQ59077.1 hypothetical protein GLOTRDRAFT_33370 [Gloeophyllum trabeum ATCC 11539]
MPGPSAFVPPLPPPPPPTSASSALGKRPATSDVILGRTQRKTADDTRKAQKKIDNAMLVPDTPPNAAHANLLATKWLNTTKLAELAETQGLVYKKGKFSAIEEEQLKNAIEHYRTKNELSYEQIHEMIFSKNDKRDQNFWSEITAAVPQRPIVAVYHHVRRTHHPLKARGKWMPSEDESLIQAVSDLGQQWEKVSQRVGRMAADCRDRYRNHLADRDKRAIGHWTKEEEEELTRIVTEMTVEQGKDMDNDVFWGVVAKRMGDRRGRQQCRIKWTDSLSKTYKSGGQKPRWSQRDAHILVHKIASLNVRDDTEIDWKVLPDESWNLWSAHILQRRWMTLKKSVRGWEDMTHQEIMDILTVKKADMPPSPHPHKRKQKRSAEVIAESEDGAAAGSE